MQELETRSSDGTGIPLTWFEADTTRCALLLLPALGIQSKLYNRLGEQLAGEGCSVCLMEQRGHGRSNLRPARGTRYCLADILEQDIPDKGRLLKMCVLFNINSYLFPCTRHLSR